MAKLTENGALILVVDDEEVNRDILTRRLLRRGYRVAGAGDGNQALAYLRRESCDLVLLDIMMPEMDGLTVLRELRRDFTPSALPVIMATARDGSDDVVTALESGASDYVTKPIDFPVLLARIETQLRLKKTSEELAAAYRRIKQEIEAAARVQRSQIPDNGLLINGLRCACRYLPCAELGGDILNYFAINEREVAVYLLDVSGHGAGAALLSSGLSRLLSAPLGRQFSGAGGVEGPGRRWDDQAAGDPGEILSRLNRRFPIDQQTCQFFTIIYATIDPGRRRLNYAAAGHPGFLRQDAAGLVHYENNPGLPVGILENTEYRRQELELPSESRLLFFSDGIIEALNREQEQFGVQRLIGIMAACRNSSLDDLLDGVVAAVQEWSADNLQDDISLVALELE